MLSTNCKSRVFRFSILACACLITLGDYFSYDLPGALGNETVEKFFHVGAFEYELLYSLYSWPNTVLAFLGGVLVDRVFGVFGAVVFTAVVSIAQLILAVAFQARVFSLALVARLIFGLGGESVAVVQNATVVSWFTGKELALALAIAISFSRVGSAINFNVTPALSNSIGTAGAVWFSLVLCGASNIAALVLLFLDRRGEKLGFKPKDSQPSQQSTEPSHGILKGITSLVSGILKFPLNVWLLYLAVIAFYVAQFVFMTIGNTFITTMYHTSKATAGTYLSIPYTLAALSCPFVGITVDLIAHQLMIMLGATCIQMVTFLLMIYTPIHPVASLILLGIAYTLLASSIWSCIPLLVHKSLHATAFGLAFSLQNLGLAIAPLAVGRFVDASGDYMAAIWFFLTCSTCGVAVVICMIVLNWLTGGSLNTSRKRIVALTRGDQGTKETTGLLADDADKS